MVQGQLQIKDRAQEYIDRGDALECWSFLDFFLGTYDGPLLKERQSHRGRKPNTRVPYQEGSNRQGHCRIIRSAGHETMPYFPGQWFPKRQEENQNGLFEASMLALLKPWRTIADLKQENQSFREAFDSFIVDAPTETRRIITNVQFFHECSDGARQRRVAHGTDIETRQNTVWTELETETVEDSLEATDTDSDQLNNLISEKDIYHVLNQPYSPREQLFAEAAISIGTEAGVLRDDEYSAAYPHAAPLANDNDLQRFRTWESVLRNEPDQTAEIASSSEAHDVLSLGEIPMIMDVDSEPTAIAITQEAPPINDMDLVLNERQMMAYTIVTNHLRDHLSQRNPPQRLVIVHGQGGTGKSALLNAISKTFDDLGASDLLAKTAMSGVAASIIGGQTLHSWAALPIKTPRSEKWLTHPSKEILARRKKNMGSVLWLTIDEMSMMTTPLLVYLSQATGVVRSGLTGVDASIPFGGLNVILLGDFHQFPPVASAKRELYNPSPENGTCQLGRNLFEQFDIVIRLDQQIRIRDVGWMEILQRTRTGDCTYQDIAAMKKLVLTNPDCDIPDFLRPPWSDTILITSRNCVRNRWNELMLEQHARRAGQIKYVLYAFDRTNGQPLTKQQRLAVAHLKLDDTNNLPHKVELVIGMKAMVTMNISTDTDLANGSRGVVEDIILDPRERIDVDHGTTIQLQYPPAAILFKPFFSRKHKFPDLPEGTVPIFPTQKKFKLGGKSGVRIEREQFALTPAYAFTDFKSQGQTIESVIVDLAKPPSGNLTGFHAYVSLSRSRGRGTIRLLRDFDESLFTRHPNEHLRKEDARLERLEKETKKRYDAGEFGFSTST